MRIFSKGWQVAYRRKAVGTILHDRTTPFCLVKNSWRYMAADPFLVVYHGDTYLFAELYDNLRKRGIIGYCRWENERFSSWRPALIEPFHLSFPNIWEENGEFFMVPETYQDNRVNVYRAVKFPDQWEKCGLFLEGMPCADTIIFNNGQVKTAFTCRWSPERNEAMYNDLVQFSLNQTPMKASSATVIRTGEYACRPAGKSFIFQEKNVLVFQDGRGEYGRALVFNFICNADRLGKERLEDQEVYRCTADDVCLNKKKRLYGVHTYNGNDGFEVIDLRIDYYNVLSFFRRVWNRLNKFFLRRFI